MTYLILLWNWSFVSSFFFICQSCWRFAKFINLSKETTHGFVDLPCNFSVFSFIYLCFYPYYLVSFSALGWFYSSYSWFWSWTFDYWFETFLFSNICSQCYQVPSEHCWVLSHRFCCVVFSFLFTPMHFFPWDFPLDLMIFRSVLIPFQEFGDFSVIFFCFLLWFHLVRKHTVLFHLFLIVEICFMDQDVACLGIWLWALEKNVYSAVAGWYVLKMSIRSCCLMMLLSSIFVLIFCLVVLSIVEKSVLKFTTIIIALSVFLFYFTSFHITQFAALLFGRYTFRVVMSSCCFVFFLSFCDVHLYLW